MKIARLSLAAAAIALSACAVATRAPLNDRQMAELWQEPADLDKRDLLYGPGGRGLKPAEQTGFAVLEIDTEGFSPGYDVRDPQGRTWSVKIGPEAQTEVVVSRLLWAIGYHQPVTYYLPRWTMTKDGRPELQPEARFRLESQEVVGEWAWRDNPFVSSRPFEGLLAFMIMVNNWDLKTSQNKIYRTQVNGDDARYLYVVRDLGASFGRSRWIVPGTRNDLEGFEAEGFIKEVRANRVIFDYKGGWLEPQAVASVAPADVRWVSDLLDRLSPRQWMDAFRAGGFSDADAERYIRRLRAKVAEGRNLS
jgi:hypothetical protein